jgi:Fe-S oxidoreductase
MNPLGMLCMLVAFVAMFVWSAHRRWQLLTTGRPENRLDRIPERLEAVWRYAFVQEKMDYYQPAGWAHKLVFAGFVLLLFRILMLWGRGFAPGFDLWVLDPHTGLGSLYELVKDCLSFLVLCGVAVFFYYRVINPLKRITRHWEGTLILGIIAAMMLGDMFYDGASMALADRAAYLCGEANAGSAYATADQCKGIATLIAPFHGAPVHAHFSFYPSPVSSFMAGILHDLAPRTLIVIAHVGFWLHAGLPLVFLNLLPYSKHFHVITAIPNVFLKNMDHPGRLKPMAENAEKLMEVVGAAAEHADPTSLPVGVARIEHFTWKAILDFYTCTECGRCSDNCPAHKTGKILSPKHLTLDLRNHLYGREKEIIEHGHGAPAGVDGVPADAAPKPINLFPEIIHPDVLWACTTCRACEEQCPVMISYVDKIVDMRRNLVMIRGEFPHELQKPFQGMEVNGNPWNLSRMDRSAWSDGLGIPMMSEKPQAEVLYWVGCAASYDDRAKKIARATAKLMKQAGVDFAILGQEESCTGDPARRAGNEFLFATMAEANAATLNGYKEQGGMKTVVTACPHCFNTLKNEYPDFGAKLDVVHHTDFLLGLLAEQKLVPKNAASGRVVYHDSCYLGRYNGVYQSPREILKSIPGVELVEPEYWSKQRGLCCGAGGAQMFMEEQNTNRVNIKRTLQLVDTGATTVASACPFCMTMLHDGLKSQNLEEKIQQLDVAEILERACADVETGALPAAAE